MNNIRKNNVKVLILIIALTMTIGLGLSYAYFSSKISGNESASTIAVEGGTLSVVYDNLSDVIVVPVMTPREEEWITKEFKVTGSNTTDLVLFYKIKMVIDTNEFDGLGLSYILTSENTSNNGNVIPSVSKELFWRDDVVLGQGYFTNTGNSAKEHKYTLKIYFKDSEIDQSYLQGAKFAAHIEIEAGDKAVPLSPQGWDEAGSGTLLAGIKTNYPTAMQPITNPGKEGTQETEAVLAGTADDYGMSYYFRGNVTNNYVQFANKCWRIVRVTGDGSIKLVLHNDNVNSVTNPCDSTNNDYDAAYAKYDGTTYTTVFNEITYETDENAYIGFMYGTPGSSTYAETHANIHKSTILQNLEKWYKSNLASYESKLADTIWCNDKSTQKVISYYADTEKLINGNKVESDVNSGFGYGKNATYYTASQRIESNYIVLAHELNDGSDSQLGSPGTGPSLICPVDNNGGKLSKFTVNDIKKGNGALDYKIGLLTVDEVVFAGKVADGHYNSSVSMLTYLNENAYTSFFSTLSPNFSGVVTQIYNCHGYDTFLNHNWIVNSSALRPAISLKSDTTISSGNGTSSDPFVIN